MAALNNEADMPLEQLLLQYGYLRRQSAADNATQEPVVPHAKHRHKLTDQLSAMDRRADGAAGQGPKTIDEVDRANANLTGNGIDGESISDAGCPCLTHPDTLASAD